MPSKLPLVIRKLKHEEDNTYKKVASWIDSTDAVDVSKVGINKLKSISKKYPEAAAKA